MASGTIPMKDSVPVGTPEDEFSDVDESGEGVIPPFALIHACDSFLMSLAAACGLHPLSPSPLGPLFHLCCALRLEQTLRYFLTVFAGSDLPAEPLPTQSVSFTADGLAMECDNDAASPANSEASLAAQSAAPVYPRDIAKVWWGNEIPLDLWAALGGSESVESLPAAMPAPAHVYKDVLAGLPSAPPEALQQCPLPTTAGSLCPSPQHTVASTDALCAASPGQSAISAAGMSSTVDMVMASSLGGSVAEADAQPAAEAVSAEPVVAASASGTFDPSARPAGSDSVGPGVAASIGAVSSAAGEAAPPGAAAEQAASFRLASGVVSPCGVPAAAVDPTHLEEGLHPTVRVLESASDATVAVETWSAEGQRVPLTSLQTLLLHPCHPNRKLREGGVFRIGRSEKDADLMIHSRLVSRVHATVEQVGQTVVLGNCGTHDVYVHRGLEQLVLPSGESMVLTNRDVILFTVSETEEAHGWTALEVTLMHTMNF
eukprot:TRINITY_DN24822_c0_g1_i1.p1 TRINITY_DN24822_c0_g1~~TRINITY_DN24822_c0_g1_i1.p1  ORF type:complete len:488 (+),score=93.61 TRINITY_DN24822_c0_g1_i1:104-1567(+)